MRLDPSVTSEEWEQRLRQAAIRLWGERRLTALAENLKGIAASLYQLANYTPASEEEPFLLDAEPFPYEET